VSGKRDLAAVSERQLVELANSSQFTAATNDTLVWFVTSMDPAVTGERARVGESFAASLTLVRAFASAVVISDFECLSMTHCVRS
jgi:hypothetical protein